MGCPVRATMETVVVCETAEGFPVHFDRYAYEADHVLVCGRVKPHTDFVGEIESGLMKMMLIGLGKHEGAKVYHQDALREWRHAVHQSQSAQSPLHGATRLEPYTDAHELCGTPVQRVLGRRRVGRIWQYARKD